MATKALKPKPRSKPLPKPPRMKPTPTTWLTIDGKEYALVPRRREIYR
jgi:hypothetical protein